MLRMLITLITCHIMITRWSSFLLGCNAYVSREDYYDRGSSSGEYPTTPQRAIQPRCIHCFVCSILDHFIYKKKCHPQYPTEPSQPPSTARPPPTTRPPSTTTRKPYPPGNCESYGDDLCGCQEDPSCASDLEGKSCTNAANVCSGLTFAEDECRKSNQYYAFRGVLCRNQNRGGNCATSNVVTAVNVQGVKAVGSDGILYASGLTLKVIDPEGSRKSGRLSPFHLELLGLTHIGDKILYGSYLHSLPSTKPYCLSTPLRKLENGRYDLILKFMDSAEMGRTFDVKLNGITVLKDFRIVRYTGRNYRPLQVIIKFQVVGNSLQIPDHPSSTIKDHQVLLSFCHGSCTNYIAYAISAFALVQYPLGTRPTPPAPPPPRPPPPPPPPPELTEVEKCREAGADIRKCKELPFCGYSVHLVRCQHKSELCSPENFNQADDCLIPGSWVSVDGDVCKITHELSSASIWENCEIKGVITAVNLGGGTVTASDGITYSGTPPEIEDPYGILSYNEPSRLPHISGIAPEDQDIYNSFVGGTKPHHFGRCAQFPIELEQDGSYLLRLKFAEHIYQELGKRRFTIRLNGRDILKEFDILSIASFGEGKDVFVNFKISDGLTMLAVTGYPMAWPIYDKTLNVEVCNGYGNAQDNSPILSGYSVVQLGRPPGPPPPATPTEMEQCREAGSDIVKCLELEFCRFNSETKICQHREEFCSNLPFDEKRHCIRPGMIYSINGDTCLIPESASSNNINCGVKEVLVAVNVGGPTTTGSDGKVYEGQDINSGGISDPNGILSSNKPPGVGDVSGINEQDRNIYNTFVVGNGDASSAGKCAQFPIKLKEDGDYELTLKFAEHVYREMGKRRFTVRMNGREILKEFDILSIAMYGEGKDVLLHFEVTEGLKNLTMTGYPGTWSITEETLLLEICAGQGTANDNGPILSGFTIVQLMTPCAAYSSGDSNAAECRCVAVNTNAKGKRGCGYDSSSGTCVDLEHFCNQAFAELNRTMNYGLCRLYNAHYTFNGQTCFTGYQNPYGPIQKCLSGFGMGKGLGIDFNGIEHMYHDSYDVRFVYREGKIDNLERHYTDDRGLREFLTPGSTPNTNQALWDIHGVSHVMKTWFVANGEPGRCLSIRLDKLYGNLNDGEYFLVAMIPDVRKGLREGQERVFDIKINDMVIARNVNPSQLSAEVRSEIPPSGDDYDVPGEEGDDKRLVGELKIVTYVKITKGQVHMLSGDKMMPVPLNRNIYNYQICNGLNTCGYKSSNFVVAGIYIFPARYTARASKRRWG